MSKVFSSKGSSWAFPSLKLSALESSNTESPYLSLARRSPTLSISGLISQTVMETSSSPDDFARSKQDAASKNRKATSPVENSIH